MSGRAAFLVLASSVVLACSGDARKAPPPPPSSGGPATTTGDASAAGRIDALDQVFGTQLTAWTIALNNKDASITRPSLPVSLATDLRSRWSAVLAAAEAATSAAEAALDERTDELHLAITSFNRALTAARLDYALDTAVISTGDVRHVLLFSFVLEKHRVYEVGEGRAVTVHWARRLDTLAYRYQLLGFTGRAGDPLILLPVLEREMITTVLPLIDSAEHAGTGSDALDALVHQAARAAAIDIAGRDVVGLAGLVARRAHLFDQLNIRLRARGVAVASPASRLSDPSWRRDLVRWLEEAEVKTLEEIEAALARPAMAVAYASLQRSLIVGVEHHEVQHQIDFAGNEAFDALELESGLDDEGRTYVAREVSAQLSEMARASAVASISLARIIGRATAEHQTLERIVGRRIIALLTGASDVLTGEELEVAARALLARSAEKLSSDARAAWGRGFGRALAVASLRDQDAGVHGAP